jgi:magnesium chelatase subunit I
MKHNNKIKRWIVSAQNYYQLLNWIWLKSKISEVCSQLDVDGLRGDIVTNRAAKAYAAYNGLK